MAWSAKRTFTRVHLNCQTTGLQSMQCQDTWTLWSEPVVCTNVCCCFHTKIIENMFNTILLCKSGQYAMAGRGPYSSIAGPLSISNMVRHCYTFEPAAVYSFKPYTIWQSSKSSCTTCVREVVLYDHFVVNSDVGFHQTM